MEIKPETALSIGTMLVSIGGAWAVVRHRLDTLTKRIEDAVPRREFSALKDDLLLELRSLKRMLFNEDGQSVYVPRGECKDNKDQICTTMADLKTKLGEMDEKRDRAREQDQKAFELVRTDISLIKQKINIMHSAEDDGK